MRDYAELVKALRCCSMIDARNNGCDSCPYEYCGEDCQNLCGYAADAIEELLNRDVVPTDFHERCLQLETSKRIELEKQIPHWISVEANQKLPVSGLACTVGYFKGGKYGQLYWFDFVSKDENGVVVPHSTDIEGDCIAVFAIPEPPEGVE